VSERKREVKRCVRSEPSSSFIDVRRPVRSDYPEARRCSLLLFAFSLSLSLSSSLRSSTPHHFANLEPRCPPWETPRVSPRPKG
jgi:hypothetical protein